MSADRKTPLADDDDDDAVNEAVNAMGPAGESADPNVGRIVSGQPAGGPHDLGRKAHDRVDA